MVSEKVQPEKMICAFNFVSTLSVSPAHPAVRHSNLAAKYCHMNKSTLKGGKWCPRKCNWKNDLSMHFCIKVWHRHFSIQLLSCHPIKSTSLGGKCSVWEDVTGKEMCAHLLLLFFFTNTTCDEKNNNNRCRLWCILSSPIQCRYPRCIASYADLLRGLRHGGLRECFCERIPIIPNYFEFVFVV